MPQLRLMYPTVTGATIYLHDSETILCLPGNVCSNYNGSCLWM